MNNKDLLYIKCSACDGNGFILGHSPYPGDHDEDGTCNGACPVKEPCGECKGEGYFTFDNK